MEKLFKILIILFLFIISCNSINEMRIATFFQPIKDSEHLDVETTITIPDQSLTVREILTRFSRGQMSIPPIEEGDDDDIDSIVGFDDIVDAHDTITGVNNNLNELRIKSATPQPKGEKKTKDDNINDAVPTEPLGEE